MGETINSLLAHELEKLEPQERDKLKEQDVKTAVEDRLSEMGIRTLVPKREATVHHKDGIKVVHSGLIDLEKPIEEPHLEAVRGYIAESLRQKLEGLR